MKGVQGTPKLYLVVTPDRYELPLFVSPYVSEVAEKFHATIKRIELETHSKREQKKAQGIMRGFKFIKIDIEEDDDEPISKC